MKTLKINIDDYIYANKVASRNEELEDNGQFKSITKIHNSKKIYNRKRNKKINIE